MLGRREVLGPDHADTLFSTQVLAILHNDRKEFQEAAALLEEVVAIQRRSGFDDDPDFSRKLYNWAAVLQSGGQNAESIPVFRELLSLHEERD